MKSFFLKLRIIQRIFTYGDRINPTRDWFVLLTISGVLLCASIGWNIWLFSRVTAGQAIGTATSTPVAKNIPLDTVEAVFQNRSEQRANYMNTYHFVDPSL